MKSLRSTDPWEIRRENVVVRYEDKLGSGAFADVYVGELYLEMFFIAIY